MAGARPGPAGAGSTTTGTSRPLLQPSHRPRRGEDGVSRTVPTHYRWPDDRKAGPFSIGALNIRTGDVGRGQRAGDQLHRAAVKRDILRRAASGESSPGGRCRPKGPAPTRPTGSMPPSRFYDNVNFNGYYARTRTTDRTGDDASYQAAFNYAGDRYGLQLDHLLVGDDFNPEVGFLRRRDFRRTFALARFSPRPASLRAVRQFTWEAGLDYIENGAGAVETRLMQARFDTELENSDASASTSRTAASSWMSPSELLPTSPFRSASTTSATYSCRTRWVSSAACRAPGRSSAAASSAATSLRSATRGAASRSRRASRWSRRVRQPHHPSGGGVHGDAPDEPHDLHVHAAHVLRRPAPIQLHRVAARHQSPAALGVPAGERALRRLQRPTRHRPPPPLPSSRTAPSSSS